MVKKGTKKPRNLLKSVRFPLIEKELHQRTQAELVALILAICESEEMLKDPDKWLGESERLVAAGGTHNYKAGAEILHDLREAVGGDEGDKIARRHAANLAKKHPTLNHLKSSLRKRGLLG